MKISADNILKYLSYICQETNFVISCKQSQMEKICMEFQILCFLEKNDINFLSAELVQRVVKVKLMDFQVQNLCD